MLQTIEITISDGMVQYVDFPPGTRVIIRDYDVAGPDDSGDFDIQKDENGDFYERMAFSHPTSTLLWHPVLPSAIRPSQSAQALEENEGRRFQAAAEPAGQSFAPPPGSSLDGFECL